MIKECIKKHRKLYLKVRKMKIFFRRFPYYLKNPGRICTKAIYSQGTEVVKVISEKDRHCFFGYYDSSPWSPDERYILYLSVPLLQRHPSSDDSGEIKCLDIKSKKNERICETRAWNWQQGCMLKWLSDKSTFIFNDHRRGDYCSVIKNIDTGDERINPFPYYTINERKEEALSLNFQRLQQLRPGYGYYNGTTNMMPSSKDGIFHLDLKSGEVELILSIDEFSKDIKSPKKEHWINHISYNPRGTRAVFLHRFVQDGRRRTRMFTMKPDGTDLYCLCESGYVSHFSWKDDQNILAWAQGPTGEINYHLFKDKTNHVKTMAVNKFDQDGHPSFSPGGGYLLTDTYPDNGGWKKLILYDIRDDKLYNIGDFYTPPYYFGSLRCDLHPRWDRSGQRVSFDSVHHGVRKMYVMDVSHIVDG